MRKDEEKNEGGTKRRMRDEVAPTFSRRSSAHTSGLRAPPCNTNKNVYVTICIFASSRPHIFEKECLRMNIVCSRLFSVAELVEAFVFHIEETEP